MKNMFDLLGISLLSYMIFINAHIARGDEIKMAFGLSLPPYVIRENNSGMEMDIIREALKFRGHTLSPLYVPLVRVPLHFKQGRVNAAQRDGGNDMTRLGGHYGDTSIEYHNMMFTLKEREIRIDKPEDLKGLKVVAFQNAIRQFPDWLEPARKAGNYYETGEQIQQVRMLHKGHCEVILADKNIIAYFTKKVAEEKEVSIRPTEAHDIIGPYAYRPIFRDPKTRDDFNAGLKNLHETGRYDKIIGSYLE